MSKLALWSRRRFLTATTLSLAALAGAAPISEVPLGGRRRRPDANA